MLVGTWTFDADGHVKMVAARQMKTSEDNSSGGGTEQQEKLVSETLLSMVCDGRPQPKPQPQPDNGGDSSDKRLGRDSSVDAASDGGASLAPSGCISVPCCSGNGSSVDDIEAAAVTSSCKIGDQANVTGRWEHKEGDLGVQAWISVDFCWISGLHFESFWPPLEHKMCFL